MRKEVECAACRYFDVLCLTSYPPQYAVVCMNEKSEFYKKPVKPTDGCENGDALYMCYVEGKEEWNQNLWK